MDKYRLTPHKITICVLIEYYLNGSINYHQKQSLSHLLIKHIKENNYENIVNEISLYEFIEKELKYVLPIPFINNEFLRMIQFDSVDDIYQFMISLKNLFNIPAESQSSSSSSTSTMIKPPTQLLDYKSILGIFVKKVILNFNQILFDGLIKLYDQLDQYLNEFYFEIEKIQKRQQQQQQQQHQQHSNDQSIDMDDIEDEEQHEQVINLDQQQQKLKLQFLSPLDEERFIYEETIRINSLIGRSSQKEIEQQINQLKMSLPNVKRVHLISLLFNIGYQDYDSSLEDLHRYFDYVNGQITNTTTDTSTTTTNLNLMLPYAVLNLVRLHYHFGHYEESYLALREAIRIAQERSDHSCLALADHWLARLLKKSIYNSMESSSLLQYLLASHSDSEILKKSIDRSIDLEMPDLLALNHTAFSKYKLENGELSSGGVSSSSSSTTNMFGKSFHLWNDIFQPIEISRLLDKSSSNATIAHHLYSSSWELLGNNDIAQYFTELAMKSNQSTDLSLQHDPLRAININNSNHHHHHQQVHNSPQLPPDIISFCKLSLIYSKNNKFNEALQLLIKCFSIYKTQHLCGNLLSFTILSILFDYMILDGSDDDDNHMISIVIESLLSLTNRFQSEDSIEGPGCNQILICYQKLIKYYSIKRGMFEKSINLIYKGIQIAKDFALDSQVVYFYLLLSKISSNNHNHYMNGLSDTLSALSLSNNYHLSQSIAQSNLNLIKIHLSTDKIEKAISLINETLPLVLSTNNNNLNSQLYLLWSKSLISSENSSGNSFKTSLEYLNRSESLINANTTNIEDIEILKEIYYLKSIIYNNLNDIENRNLYSKKFKSTIIMLNNKNKNQSSCSSNSNNDPKVGLIPPTLLLNPILKTIR